MGIDFSALAECFWLVGALLESSDLRLDSSEFISVSTASADPLSLICGGSQNVSNSRNARQIFGFCQMPGQ